MRLLPVLIAVLVVSINAEDDKIKDRIKKALANIQRLKLKESNAEIAINTPFGLIPLKDINEENMPEIFSFRKEFDEHKKEEIKKTFAKAQSELEGSGIEGSGEFIDSGAKIIELRSADPYGGAAAPAPTPSAGYDAPTSGATSTQGYDAPSSTAAPSTTASTTAGSTQGYDAPTSGAPSTQGYDAPSSTAAPSTTASTTAGSTQGYDAPTSGAPSTQGYDAPSSTAAPSTTASTTAGSTQGYDAPTSGAPSTQGYDAPSSTAAPTTTGSTAAPSSTQTAAQGY